MNSSFRSLAVLGCALLGLLALPAGAQTSVQYFIVIKGANYDQGAFVVPSLDGTNPYFFHTNVSGSNLNGLTPAPTFTSATGSGTTGGTLVLNGDNTSYKLNQNFSSKSALDAAFANGTYLMTVGTYSNLSLGLTPDTYPTTIPRIMSTLNGATWNGSGQLVINASTGDTLNFQTFGAYSSGGHIGFNIQNTTLSDVNAIYLPANGHSDAAVTTFVIPAGSLVSGQTYTAQLSFDSIVGVNTSGPSGSLGLAAFENSTTFTILAIPEPATDALGLAAAALLAVLLLRRRRAGLA